jgi:OCT family organic cation transporter-like MFS transporter 4/5
MDFDNILVEVGEFGRYQKKVYFLLCLPMLVCALNSYSYVFTAGQQKYR